MSRLKIPHYPPLLAKIRQKPFKDLSQNDKITRILLEIKEIQHDAQQVKCWTWHNKPTKAALMIDKRIQRLLSHCKRDYLKHVTTIIKEI